MTVPPRGPSPAPRRTSRPAPTRRGGLIPRPADRLPLLIAGVVVVLALVVAGALLVSALRGFGDDGADPAIVASEPTPRPTIPPDGPSASALPSAASPGDAGPPATPASDSGAGLPYVVCLDVGHGGIDWGNVYTDPDSGELIRESDINLEIAQGVRDRLEAQGVEVVLTRDSDVSVNETGADVNGDGEQSTDGDGDGVIETPNVDGPNNLDELQARVLICNDAGADAMISIHTNGAANTDLSGYESWYATGRAFSAQSQWLAEEVVSQFGAEFDAAGFSVESRGAGADTDTDIPEADLPQDSFEHYVVLSPDVPGRDFVGTTMPGAIVEGLFLSNASDRAVLTNPTGIQAIIDTYVTSLNAFFTEFPVEGKRLSTGEAQPVAGASGIGTPTAEEATRIAAAAPSPGADATPVDYAELPPPAETDNASSYLVDTYDTDRDEVALTFDCGADRGFTEEILDLLDAYGIKGSFGMTGVWAEQNPDLVQRMAREGHMIFNHTYTHQSFTGFSTASDDPGTNFRVGELRETERVVAEITNGYDMRPYWRPPYGDYGPQTLIDAAVAGYGVTVMWTVDSLGWQGLTSEEVAERCLAVLQPGEIILMHVGVQAPGDYGSLTAIIDSATAQGYSFVTVAQMMQPG